MEPPSELKARAEAEAGMHMDLILRRTSQNCECTQGLITAGEVTLYTLELPWIPSTLPGGVHDQSCVPLGVYDLVLHNTPKHPQTFALVNPNLGVIHEPDAKYPHARVACLIHVANFPHELEGCIGMGLTAGADCVNQSRAALDEFKAAVPWVSGHTLDIVNAM